MKHFEDDIIDSQNKKALIDPKTAEDMMLSDTVNISENNGNPLDSLGQEGARVGFKIEDDITAMNMIDLHIESLKPLTFYYYKRWLWIMFPWACIQTNSRFNFSAMIAKCYSSNIRYLSVAEDKLLTNHSVRIVRETKEKKQRVTRPKEDNQRHSLANINTENSVRISLNYTISEKNNEATKHSPAGEGSYHSSRGRAKKIKMSGGKGFRISISKLDGYGGQSAGNLTSTQKISNTKEGFSRNALGGDFKAFQSTRGLGRSSMLATKQSDFFDGLDQDKELLKRFRLSQTNRGNSGPKTNTKIGGLSLRAEPEETSRVHKILQRTEYRNTNKKDSIDSKSKKDKAQTIADLQSLHSMKIALDDRNSRELTNLDKKCNDLAAELNSIVSSVEKKHNVYKQLMEVHQKLQRDLLDEGKEYGQEGNTKVKAALDRIHEQYLEEKQTEQRMTRIIEICELNKSQNDVWLRGLTYYSNNLKKMIESENASLKKLNQSGINFASHYSSLSSNYKDTKSAKDHLIKSIAQLHSQEAIIQGHFSSTNVLIASSISQARHNLESIATHKLDILEEEEKNEEVSTRNETVRSELKTTREIFEGYKDMFTPGTGGETWEEKPEMKKMLENLGKMKVLETDFMQQKFDLDEMRRRNKELRRKIEILEQVQGMAVKVESNPQYLDQQETKLKADIEEEIRKIQVAQMAYRSLAKVSMTDNLIVSGIAARLNLFQDMNNNASILVDSQGIGLLMKALQDTKSRLLEVLSEEETTGLMRGDNSLYQRLLYENMSKNKKRTPG